MRCLSKHTLIALILFVAGTKISVAQINSGNYNLQDTNVTTSSGLIYTIYLVGDIKSYDRGKFVLQQLKQSINKSGKQSAVVILGDVVYPTGIPDKDEKGYNETTQDLKNVLQTFDNYSGKVFFLPGNHDWGRGRKYGNESVQNEELFIEEYFENKNVFLPGKGCPGPEEIELTPNITLIIFDSQWWFQESKFPGENGNCGIQNKNEVFIKIEDALRRNRNKKIVFATHHPLYSAGKHGGHFPASYLLFPLLELENWLYLPLPGFIYVGYRKYLGNIQDLAHPDYKELRKKLLKDFNNYPNLIYAAGHEHNLQYFQKNGLHHIISGAGSKSSYVLTNNKNADFACQCSGFNKLLFYSNGDVVTEFISVDTTQTVKKVFNKKLFNKPLFDVNKTEELYKNIDFSDSTVYKKLSHLYDISKSRRFMMGNNYRNIWNAKVKLPVFDIGKEKDGLTIIKRGGGMQTRSLRLKDKNGKQYVLRSVNKYVEKVLPENLRNTIAIKPVQDAISASHPYAALTIPKLANAAGVMHTNPKVVWVPDDPRLGIYRDDIANGIFLFEERPAGNRKDVASFNHSKKIVSTPEVLKKAESDHKHFIDQKSVLRARLFDILINDWDRHDDQWRWASFKKQDSTIYQPIPRDRDQAYFVNEGFATHLAAKVWPTRKFQGFDYTIKDVKGLCFNARYFDRTFLSQPNRDDWIRTATDLKYRLTDSVIHRAILDLPKNIYDSTGVVIEEKLKSRRDLLVKSAEQYYNFLSKNTDVVGTKKQELFKVVRKKNGDTQVLVYANNKKVKRPFYKRTFKFKETEEIRLYGLAGKDLFKITGKGDKGIKVRIIGGKGEDIVIDKSHVNGLSKKTIVYDRKDKVNHITKSTETKLHLLKTKSVNEYNRKQFKHDMVMPLLWVGYNIDDGIFWGGGAKISLYNFRDSTIHKIRGNMAFRTGAFALNYEGTITSVSPLFDLTIDADLSFPRNVDNFYGLGNETPKLNDDERYYHVRYKYAFINPMLKQTINKSFFYSIGAFYQYFLVTDTTNRFIGDTDLNGLNSSVFLPQNYLGLNARFKLGNKDNKLMPAKGIVLESDIAGYYNIEGEGKNFLKVNSDLSFYLSFRKNPRFIFAFRLGGAANIGDYEFYHANFIGGKTNLRGYRSNRFAGDSYIHQNTEIRVRLLNVNSYVFNGQLGITAFNDVGRVWYKNEDSDKWHNGNGIGLWFNPYNFTIFTVNYNRSKEDRYINFRFSYLF